MMMLFKIAWRNVWRNKARSGVVISSVAIGLFAGMFMMAFSLGIINQEIQVAIETQLSHIQIHQPDFPADNAVEDTIPQATPLLQQLSSDTSILALSGRLVTTGMISSASTASGVTIHGIHPAQEARISSISKEMLEGVYFSGKKNEIVIGRKLAEKLAMRLHGRIVLTFQSRSGDLTAGSFRIAGIFRSRNSVFDESTVFVPFEDLAGLMGTGNSLHEIAILLKDGQQSDSVAAVLQRNHPNLLVQSWAALSPEMAMLNGLFDQITYIIIGIILLALMFGIINTMLMAVLERQREFGMLMAIGMNKPRVFVMVVLESVMLTCAGIPAGILLTLGSVAWLGKQGIDMSAFSQALLQYGFSNTVYPQLQTGMFLPIILMTTGAAILSALYPAWKALQYKPAVAIRKI